MYPVSFQGNRSAVESLTRLGNKINDSHVMKSMRNVKPYQVVLAGGIILAGAMAALYASKHQENMAFSPFGNLSIKNPPPAGANLNTLA